MGRVLLLDPDNEHASQIVKALQGICCQTIICADIQSTITLMRAQKFEAVVVAPASATDWRSVLETIRHSAFQMVAPPQVICLLRSPYRGPEERVYAARKGFKVIYER